MLTQIADDAMQDMAPPGGGEYGRGARRDVRNPALKLPAAAEIQALPREQRRPLGILLRQLAHQARDEAERSLRRNKPWMFVYFRVVSVYAKHIARVIDPRD